MKDTRPSRIIGAVFAAVLALAACAHALDKDSLVYTFKESTGGFRPAGNLLMDASGNLFGATAQGPGHEGAGTIFELSPASGGGYIYSVVYTLSGSLHESFPNGSLVMDASGNIFGSTMGATTGEIFELSPNGSGGWTQTVLYVLNSNDGVAPSAVVLDTAGNLYGTVESGGAANVGYVFELSPVSGGGWNYQHIFEFNGADGNDPSAGVIVDAAGNLYGTTGRGGTSTACADTNGCGLVFELSQNAGSWTETVLHAFGKGDGEGPGAPLTMDASGNLYGTTTQGGTKGFGVVFELTQVGGVWKGHPLHNFIGANGDGAFPNTALILNNGNLYGTTLAGGGGLNGCVAGGDAGCGSAYELSLSGGTWKTTILHDFSGLNDGAFPQGVIVDASGKVFGLASGGGTTNAGIAYVLSPAAAAK